MNSRITPIKTRNTWGYPLFSIDSLTLCRRCVPWSLVAIHRAMQRAIG